MCPKFAGLGLLDCKLDGREAELMDEVAVALGQIFQHRGLGHLNAVAVLVNRLTSCRRASDLQNGCRGNCGDL